MSCGLDVAGLVLVPLPLSDHAHALLVPAGHG
jgi:hypothetical protein